MDIVTGADGATEIPSLVTRCVFGSVGFGLKLSFNDNQETSENAEITEHVHINNMQFTKTE